MSDRLFGILGNEGFELALCPLVVEKGPAGGAEQRGELRPGIRRAHVDDADRLDSRGGSALMRWGVSPDWTHRQNFFSADTKTLRYSGSIGTVISTHLPPPVMIESTEVLKWVTHILCWTWAMCFSAAASSENDQGSMNLASNTASVPSTMPSSVAAIHGITGCLTRRCRRGRSVCQ